MAAEQRPGTTLTIPPESSGASHKDSGEPDQPPPMPAPPNETPGNRRRSIAIALSVGVLVAIGAIGYWLYSRNYETTDDAQVDGHLNGVTARVDGVIKAIYVDGNQSVQAGQLVAELDSSDYQVALEQAEAELLRAQANLRAENPNVPIAQSSARTTISTSESEVSNAQAGVAAAEGDYAAALSRLQEVQANSAKAEADVARYKSLVDKEEVARSEYDQVVTTAKALAASVSSARASADSAQQVVIQRRAILAQANSRQRDANVNAPNQVAITQANQQGGVADVKAKQAQVDRAKLDLSYCKIYSPAAGVVSKRTADVGEHISKGQRLVTVADLSDLWVTANFKESQLKEMHTGQPVTISIDAYDQKLDGYVEAMPGATGSISSLLPPENATGNYVKVVQRMPVRIKFKPGQQGLDRLRPGMSVVPKVRLD
jgi:membrane fusion protein, multidrug efflux system